MDHNDIQNNSVTSRMGMWIFIFTEILLFGGLFLVYAVMRAKYSEDFHQAGLQLNTFIGAINTIVLLTSSMTVAMSITAIQKNNPRLTARLLLFTILCSLIFLVNKYFEWGHKIHLQIYPGSNLMLGLKHGYLLFFSLYFFMTGLHMLHLVVGSAILLIVYVKVKNGTINSESYNLLENGGLYWHLVDLVWIFLFPLFYLIT